MRVRVPYLPEKTIEGDAESLLSEYEREKGIRLELPIPIDDIVEKYLKLGIEFDDTHKRFGVPRSEGYFDPDILGAIYFDKRSIESGVLSRLVSEVRKTPSRARS